MIKNPQSLVTSRQETRTGFIEFALEKNRRSKPFIESAKAFQHFASRAKTPFELLTIKEIREPLLTASGLSDKSLHYFTEEDKDTAINTLIQNFLEPAGDDFVEEAVYRFLLIKGDTLGGSMRNVIGALAQQKLIRALDRIYCPVQLRANPKYNVLKNIIYHSKSQMTIAKSCR
jgi:hypothetical protein